MKKQLNIYRTDVKADKSKSITVSCNSSNNNYNINNNNRLIGGKCYGRRFNARTLQR